MQAFHGSKNLKEKLIERFEKGNYLFFPPAFGIPEPVCHLMIGISSDFRSGENFPLAVINAIPVGADLSKVVNLFLHWQLMDPVCGLWQIDSRHCVKAVAGLHQEIIDGEVVPMGDWAIVRDIIWKALEESAPSHQAVGEAMPKDSVAHLVARAALHAAGSAPDDPCWAAFTSASAFAVKTEKESKYSSIMAFEAAVQNFWDGARAVSEFSTGVSKAWSCFTNSAWRNAFHAAVENQAQELIELLSQAPVE